jgi:hypothetical protein
MKEWGMEEESKCESLNIKKKQEWWTITRCPTYKRVGRVRIRTRIVVKYKVNPIDRRSTYNVSSNG